MYVYEKRLKEIVTRDQAAGKISDELGTVFLRIAEGVCASKKMSNKDIEGAAVLVMVRVFPRIDPSKNIFKYLSLIALGKIRQHWRDYRPHQDISKMDI